MKTKFYKRLVPIALIASMAVTNVGMTSASAQEVTAGFTQSVDGDVVGAASSACEFSGGGAAGKVNVVQKQGNYVATYGNTDDSTDVDIELEHIQSDDQTKLTADSFIITETQATSDGVTCTASNKATVKAFTYQSDKSKGILTITVPKNSFGENTSLTLYLGCLTDGSTPTYKSRIDSDTGSSKTIVIKKETSSGSNPTQQAAPATGFQIPGGLTSKGTTVNAYTVGVAKVTGDTTNLSKNVVKPGDIKEGTGDNTVGKWEGDYVGTGDELKLTPAPANAGDKYVLYYVPNGSTDPMFIRLLSKAEEDSLPKGDKLTEATLTKYTDKSKKEDKEASQQYLIETSTITGVSTTDYAGYKTMAELFGIVFETVPTKNLNSAFNDTDNGFTATALAKVAVPDGDTKGLVEVPAISSVAVDAVLIKDNKFVEELIKAYDEGKTKGTDTFADMKANESGNETPYIVVKEDGTYDKNEDGSYKISATGQTKLYEILSKTNFANAKKYMTAKDVKDTTKKLYEEVYARAKALYINAYNTKLASSEADLSLLNWVMETLPGDSETVTDKNGREKTNFTKANGSAAFWGRAKATATADSAIKTAKGASVKVTNTKAASKFNASVYLKGVSKDYVPAKSATVGRKGTVYFTQGFFVPPAVPTAFTAKSLKPPTAKDGMTLATATGYADTASATRVFNLTLDVGKSMALPFKLADGQEKDLVYEISTGSTGFTVINGKVTATYANNKTFENVSDGVTVEDANVIKVSSRVNPDVYALVQVKTNAAVNSVRANASALAIWPGSVQTVSLGTVPATKNGTYKYKITYTSDAIEVYKGNSESADKVTSGTCIEDTNLITVKAVEGKTVAKGATIKVEVCNTEGEVVKNKGKAVKPLEIKLSAATAPQDVKSIKTAVKSKEILNNNKVINIPVGGAYNVGFTVAPTAADPTIDANAYNNNPAVATVSGDVITGVGVGSTQVTFGLPVNTNRADGFKSADAPNGTVTYEVKVYNPGASIKLADSRYTIKGGFLMTKEESDTTCNKVFKAGKTYSMTKPVTSPAEDIVWKANNPAAIKFVESGNNLEFTPCQTGTFTVTGTTKYTNQKLVFKVEVGAANSVAATDNGTLDFSAGNVTNAEGNTPLDVAIGAGDKINAYYSSGTEDVGGTVTFALKTATDKDKLTVSKTGLITAKSAGKVTVVATMMKDKTTELCKKEFTVTVEPKTITKKSSSGDTSTIAGDAKGAKMSIALNNYDKKTMTLAWYYVKKDDSTKNLIADNQDKLSGPVIFGDSAVAGDYEVAVQALEKIDGEVKANDLTDHAIGAPQLVGTVRVYPKDQGIKAANLDMGDKDSKKAVSALGAKYDSTKAATAGNGAGNNHVYYFPVFVSADANKTVASATDGDDVAFTVSNKSLAKCEFIKATGFAENLADGSQENDIVKNYKASNVYGFIKVTTPNNNYSGMVTIKATLRNSNKAVTIKLNLRGAAKAPNFAYAPQTLKATESTADNNKITIANVPKLDENKSQAQINALKVGKPYDEYKYVLVKSNSTGKYVKNDIVPDEKAEVAEFETTGTGSVQIPIKTSSLDDSTYYYLATVKITHKIKTAGVTSDEGKTWTKAAEVDPANDKYVVTVVSKTPIVVSTVAATPSP